MPLCHWEVCNHYELRMQNTVTGVIYPLRDQTTFGDFWNFACMQIFYVNYKRHITEVSLTSHQTWVIKYDQIFSISSASVGKRNDFKGKLFLGTNNITNKQSVEDLYQIVRKKS